MIANISSNEASDILYAHNELFLANTLRATQLQHDTHDLKNVLNLGIGYLKAKNYAAAKICFAEVKRLSCTFESTFYLGLSLEGLNLNEEAKATYLEAVMRPTSNIDLLFEAYKNIGNIFLREKNLEIAEDFYHKAYAIKGESPQLLVNLGTLELQKNNNTQAIERFRKALVINIKTGPAWLGMALCYDGFGDREMAWASLLRAVECDGRNTTVLLLLAQWALRENAMDFAITKLMGYFDSGEFDAQLSLAFIELCVHTSQFALARLEMERALLWEPSNRDLQSFEKALRTHGY